jgi:hypothetical protein
MNDTPDKKRQPPPATHPSGPESELEERLRENPHDCDAKVDVASDESMDASDPPSVTQPRRSEPVPSSGFDEEDESNP